MEPLASTDAPAQRGSFEGFFEAEARGQVQRARLLLGSEESANEVVQEALLRVFERWDTIEDPGSYLNRVVLNLCRDRGRRRRRWERMVPRLVDRSVASGDVEVLDDVLGRLPFNQRAAVVLRYWGGLTNVEIAAELGCAEGSVGPWISRAVDTLREELA